MKKNLLIAAAIASVGFTAAVPLASTLTAHAAANTTTGSSSIVDKLVSQFHLNKTDVQKVFDEEHTAREAERTQAQKDKLAAAVKAGTITQAQSDKITAKQAELKAEREKNRDAMKDKTQAERKAAMEAKKAELDAWAKAEGIDVSYLMMGHGGPGGPDGHMRGDQ